MQRAADRPFEERSVAEVMTRDLLTLGPDESVLMAWELMCQNQCHHLPVVDESGHCLGVIDAQTISVTWEGGSPQRARRPVSALLGDLRLIPVSPSDSVRTAARVMLRQGSDYVVVADENEVLIGLLTAHDLVAALAGVTRSEVPTHASMPSLYRIEPVLPERPAVRSAFADPASPADQAHATGRNPVPEQAGGTDRTAEAQPGHDHPHHSLIAPD